MKVHHSTSSYFNSLSQSQSNTDSDDSTPFALPGDDNEQQGKATATSTSSSTVTSSISSGFWMNQSGASTVAASGDASGSSTEAADTSTDDLLAEFAKLANMTPAEKIRDQYLKAHNLTEEQFSQLSPDEQKAINDQIANEIKQQLGAGKKGEDNAESDAASALSIA